MNRFIFKKTKRDFKLLQLIHFDSMKRLSQVTCAKNKVIKKILKNKAAVKKNLFI